MMMKRRTFMGVLAAVTAAGGSGLGALLARRPRWSVASLNARTVPALEGQAVLRTGLPLGSERAGSIRIARAQERAAAAGTEDAELRVSGDLYHRDWWNLRHRRWIREVPHPCYPSE